MLLLPILYGLKVFYLSDKYLYNLNTVSILDQLRNLIFIIY